MILKRSIFKLTIVHQRRLSDDYTSPEDFIQSLIEGQVPGIMVEVEEQEQELLRDPVLRP